MLAAMRRSELTLHDDPAARRFEMDEQGQTSWADYRLSSGRLQILHVEAPLALRGTGAAARLMNAVAIHARAQGLKVTPRCSYAAAWFARRPEFGDLLD